MDYKTLMVHLDFEEANEARLKLTGELGGRFGAAVIGIAAGDFSPAPYYPSGAFAQNLIAEARNDISTRLAALEAQFRDIVGRYCKRLEWRGALARPTETIAREARAADLIITSLGSEELVPNPFRTLDASALVMQAGRPLLLVPQNVGNLAASRVLVAWKDTREARRAVTDALPLLRLANEVAVVTVAGDEDHARRNAAEVADIAAWLERHGVAAAARAVVANDDTAAQIESVASDFGADLIVAGAYGHVRLREWIFGGVTEELLTRSTRCVLLSN